MARVRWRRRFRCRRHPARSARLQHGGAAAADRSAHILRDLPAGRWSQAVNWARFLRLAGAPNVRPFIILAGAFAAIAMADLGFGTLLHRATIFSVTQLFAPLGLAALGPGLTMIVDEFDLAIPGSFTVAGAVAVLTVV